MKKFNRRNFLKLAFGTLGWAAFFSLPNLFASKPQLRPPGAVKEDEFMATCVRCTRCVTVCPKDAIRTATYRDSMLIAGSPIFTGPCDRCLKCIETCPSGALQPVDSPAVSTGSVQLLTDDCIACGACIRNCPFDGIKAEGREIKVDVDNCIGCGECIQHCPQDPPALKLVIDGEERQKWQRLDRGVREVFGR